MCNGAIDGFQSLEEALDGQSNRPIANEETVYLSPAPLYHSAPLEGVLLTLRGGGTALIMEKFDAIETIRLIEKYKVTTSQWVPTMFIRMLKLPEKERLKYDLSSHKIAVHAAAPIPVPVKEQMLDWWGPLILEYYGGTETGVRTFITSEEWLAHKGSVGKAVMGTVKILDGQFNELPAGEVGTIYFAGGRHLNTTTTLKKPKRPIPPGLDHGKRCRVSGRRRLPLLDRP